MGVLDIRERPTGLRKWFLHTPTRLYRIRLGFLMGERFLMIEHTGRRSGELYRTVLEVAGRDADRNEWHVFSGWGPRADWYRNLAAGGLVAVWVGSKRYSAKVRFPPVEEAAPVFHEYELAHPIAAVKLMDAMGVSYDGTDGGRAGMLRDIPMVTFVLHG